MRPGRGPRGRPGRRPRPRRATPDPPRRARPPPPPPPFVKPNTPRPAPAARAPARNAPPSIITGGRAPRPPKSAPMPTTPVRPAHYPLTGRSIARRREVLELPPPAPVRVIEYQVLKRYCPHCRAMARTRPESGRAASSVMAAMSVRIMALVAWLRTALRLPVRQIQRYLAAFMGCTSVWASSVPCWTRWPRPGRRPAAAIKADLRPEPAPAHGRDELAGKWPERLRVGDDQCGGG